jgi:ABC-2 type transport system ATP-binding protein
MTAVEICGVTKSYGRQVAVSDLTLTVPRGCTYGFIGPNGSGKTTTLRMIMNILLPDAGSIRLLGGSPPGACAARLGYLPEERGLYRRMRVREHLRFLAELRTGCSMAREVDGWLERMGLGGWGDRRVEALSKGMSQKVQFIAAVVTRPELLVLDEPFSGLDPVNADLLQGVLRDLRASGVTVLFSTHDMGIAERLCDYLFMIFRGRKVLDGTLDEIQGRGGADLLRVRLEGGAEWWAGLAGVEQVRERGPWTDLRLATGVDPQAVLAELMQRGRLMHFEVAKPSLHEIFVRIAGPESEEPDDEPGAVRSAS